MTPAPHLKDVKGPLKISRITPIYLGDHKWRFEGLDYPDLYIEDGEDLLSKKPKFVKLRQWIKKKFDLSEEQVDQLLIRFAKVIDDTYVEEVKERAIENAEKRLEDLPRWRHNTELLKKADDYVSKRLREIRSVKEYLDFLRNEVLKHLVAGEDDNKLVMATLLQGKGFIIILPGPPSIGKNYFADAFVECLDVYTTHRITEHGLEHIPEDEVEGKILYIKEAESLSDHPSHVMKSFYRDYQEDVEAFIITYPIKDPATGKQKSIKQELRVKGIITTTNLEWMDRSLLERAWIIDLDPSPEQTSRVLEFIGRDEDEKSKVKLGLLKWTSRQWSQALFYNLLKRIEDVEIWIPGREHIPKIVFRKRVNDLETRRDARRILRFLENFARLCSPILDSWRIGDVKFKMATVDVIIEGIRLYLKLVHNKKRIKRPTCLRFAEKLLQHYHGRDEVVIDLGERHKLARAFNRSKDTIYKRLKELSETFDSVEVKDFGRSVGYCVNIPALEVEIKACEPPEEVLSEEQLDELQEAMLTSLYTTLYGESLTKQEFPAENNSSKENSDKL